MTILQPDQAPLLHWLTNEIWERNYWEWFKQNVWNGGSGEPVEFNLEKDLKRANQTVAMVVHSNGELHILADGKDVGMPWNNLPVNVPMYGVVGLENFGTPDTQGSFELGKRLLTLHSS